MSQNREKRVKNIEKSSKMSENAEKTVKMSQNREKRVKNIEKSSKMSENAEKTVKMSKNRKKPEKYRKIVKNVEKR